MISIIISLVVLSGSLIKKVLSLVSKVVEFLVRFQMSLLLINSLNVDNENGEGSYIYEKLDWLKEDKRRY